MEGKGIEEGIKGWREGSGRDNKSHWFTQVIAQADTNLCGVLVPTHKVTRDMEHNN